MDMFNSKYWLVFLLESSTYCGVAVFFTFVVNSCICLADITSGLFHFSAVALNLLSCLFFSEVWIQPGEMDFDRAAASLPGPVLPPLLADVQQPSGKSQGQPQVHRLAGLEPQAPQSQPELRRRPQAAPSHCQVLHT